MYTVIEPVESMFVCGDGSAYSARQAINLHNSTWIASEDRFISTGPFNANSSGHSHLGVGEEQELPHKKSIFHYTTQSGPQLHIQLTGASCRNNRFVHWSQEWIKLWTTITFLTPSLLTFTFTLESWMLSIGQFLWKPKPSILHTKSNLHAHLKSRVSDLALAITASHLSTI